MAEKNLGKIAMTFAGDWDANTSYERLVAVTYQGSSWVSTRAVPAGIAPSSANATYWQKLAAKGEPTSVINDLTTGGVEAALSAEMGKNLNTKVAQLDQEVENIKVSGIGGCGFAEVAEEGFFFVDAEGYIGASVDSKGFHSINTIEIS